MIRVILGVPTCDKCGKSMDKTQRVLLIAEGTVQEANDELDVEGSCVRYACHLACWDGIEEADDD